MPRYAIVQKTLDPPSTEQLVRAFEAVPELTKHDAMRLCRTAFGIIVRGRTLPVAQTLQAALRNEGLDTWVVDQARLPALPPPKGLRKAFVREHGLVALDMYGREQAYPWACFGMAAAGSLMEHDTQRKITRSTDVVSLPTTGAGIYGGSFVVHRTKVTHEHTDRVEMMLDLFTNRAPHRWRIEATKFNYETLGPRASHSKYENFNLLATEVLGHLPHAGFNIGATAMAETDLDIFQYPDRATFDEELTWLFWQAEEMPGIVG